MLALARLRSVHCVLLAVIVLTPVAVLAQQDKTSQEASQAKKEPAQPKTEDAQKQTEGTQAQTEKDPKVISGMSILGNQEAPKALVIVPWKSSELGSSIGISTMLDDSRLPIDKEVFMRMLSYYEIRSGAPQAGSSPAERNTAQPAAAANGRKQ